MTAILRCLVVAATWLASTTMVIADSQSDPQATQAPDAVSRPRINAVELAILIKSTLIAVQHANATGNYSVLRDLGSAGFRNRYDQAMLTAIFANFRARAIDLNPILMLRPDLTKPVVITPQGQLRVEGTFPTKPLQIQYALLFQQQGAAWRLDGVAVDAVPNQDAVAAVKKIPNGASAHDLKKSKPAARKVGSE